MIFDLKEENVKITIVALYAPNIDSPGFFKELAKILREKSEYKILVGDYNLTLDIEKDRLNTYHNNNTARDEVLGIMEEFYLADTWRNRNEEAREFSWFKKLSRGEDRKASRIDYALISSGLDQHVHMIDYISSIMTDHRAIYLVVDFSESERGTGYWKLNTLLLTKKEYVEKINMEIDKTLASSIHMKPLEKWEKIKERIKKASIAFSRENVAESKLVIAHLSEQVNEYERSMPLEQGIDEIYMKTKHDLKEKQLERTAGIMFRSKAKWYEEGERNTAYFYALEKARYNYKTCYKMFDEQYQLVQNQSQILKVQRDYYYKLYSKDEDVDFTLENTFNVYVPPEIKRKQDEQITCIDLEEAIKKMNNKKTPGEDGIPVDFYKMFWNKLKTAFYEMCTEVYRTSKLHATARNGILNLIPKPGKDSRMIKNLRPITLLNTDYKIIEKAVANKMLPALNSIIHTDQRGFMKDRRISVNIRKMLDIIHQAEKEDLEAIVMSMDFVKCFDKCSLSILHGSLNFFQFGEVVKKWTEILYDDFGVKIQNNGHFSENIPIRKGVHQGGCCSSIYFLVIAEILALSLRSNMDIDGITLKDIRNLLNQFADDMDIFSLCNEKSLQAIQGELEIFRRQSGFTVSYEKTTIYRIGSLRFSDAQMYNMSEFVWSNEDINVLGVTITHQELVKKNYQPIIDKAKKVLSSWSNRNLTLMGRVQVVNTLISSLFVYKMMVLPNIDKNTIKTMDNIIRSYIWKDRKSKIAYQVLQNPKYAGGLGLVNLKNKEIALKATWPKILYHETEYEQLVYSLMRVSTLGRDIWRCRLEQEDVELLKTSNIFWKDVLKSWCKYNFSCKYKEENQIIWYNSLIRIKNKPFFWKDVYCRGLKYVHQLFQEQGYKMEEVVFKGIWAN